jgi:hypothetical protein
LWWRAGAGLGQPCCSSHARAGSEPRVRRRAGQAARAYR